MKRATRAALRSVTEGLLDLLYEVVWRDRPLDGGLRSADALVTPLAVSASMDTFIDYLAREGVEVGDRAALLDDLERLSRSYALAALERLGWRRVLQTSAPQWISARWTSKGTRLHRASIRTTTTS